MFITKITVRGGAGHFAEIAIERRDADAVIAVEIMKPHSNEMLRAPAGDRCALWGLATQVQEQLDGRPSEGSDICGYFELIMRVATC